MSKRTETSRPSATEAHEDDAFLSRWARRKRVARSGGDPDADEARASEHELAAHSEPAAGEAPGEDAAEERPQLTDADMPPVESIDENTDMTGFFSPGVSQALRKAALRKFFHSQAFNIVDGLDDYDDDFRSFEALGEVITSDMRGRMEREAERARESLDGEQDAARTADAESASEPSAQPQSAADAEAVEPPSAPHAQHAPAEADEPAEQEITRDPSRLAHAGPAKLRPRTRRGGDADDDSVGEGEDA